MKSPLVIGVMGVVGAAVVVVGMMISLGQLEKSPQGKDVKLALETANNFKIEGVTILKVYRGGAEQHALMIGYRAPKLATNDAANQEMDAVAKFVYGKYGDEMDRRTIHKVEVRREVTHGSGCFKRTDKSEYDYEPPPPPPIRR